MALLKQAPTTAAKEAFKDPTTILEETLVENMEAEGFQTVQQTKKPKSQDAALSSS